MCGCVCVWLGYIPWAVCDGVVDCGASRLSRYSDGKLGCGCWSDLCRKLNRDRVSIRPDDERPASPGTRHSRHCSAISVKVLHLTRYKTSLLGDVLPSQSHEWRYPTSPSTYHPDTVTRTYNMKTRWWRQATECLYMALHAHRWTDNLNTNAPGPIYWMDSGIKANSQHSVQCWIALRPDYEYPLKQSIHLSMSLLYNASKCDQTTDIHLKTYPLKWYPLTEV